MNFESTGLFPIELISFVAIGVMVITLIVHFAFAGAVFSDAQRQDDGPEFVTPVVWGMATLLGGVFVATAYWVMNRSNLRDSTR